MSNESVIVWFRRDLRLADNPALNAACRTGQPVIPVYIREPSSNGKRSTGGASKWWLNKSLNSLSRSLSERGAELILRTGESMEVLSDLIAETGSNTIFWNRRYGLAEREADSALKKSLSEKGIEAESFNGNLLTEPWTIKTGSGGHFRVFTPYWKNVRANYELPQAFDAPTSIVSKGVSSEKLEDWKLHPSNPDWSTGFDEQWSPGESGAHQRLEAFLVRAIDSYNDDRNRPDIETGTSGLSPHLAFGEIAPTQIWRATKSLIDAGSVLEESAMVFLSEIVWREFSYVLLYHYPKLATENYNRNFDVMPWRESDADYKAWCMGRTGYPMVDAGMRQLWQTGWMHNRVRMIVASFLTKHLLLPWQLGEDWFWDTLVDADPASNAASWQWTAGTGADAAPYFRVFNPITQGQKFDETGNYVRKWCPELAKLPNKYLFSPWEADPVTLAAAGVELGTTYPHPIVDHKTGRERALAAYEEVKAAKSA
ncbi:MAG: deoxyribodipyrimidine photo-lyase [Pseudomonadota bacterium]